MNNEIKKQLMDLFDKAREFEKNNMIQDALNTYLKALKIFPDYVSALTNAGAIFAQYYSKYTESLECYNRAIRNQPNNIESIIGKGTVMIKLNNFEDGILYYKRALSIDKKNFDALLGISSAYLLQNNFDLALPVLNDLLELRPNDIGILCNKGIILGEKEDFKGSEECFEKVLELDPVNPMAINNLAYLNYLKNKANHD